MKRIRPTLVTLFIAAAAVVSAFVTPPPARAANATAVKLMQSGYAAANGVNYHYRIYGKGRPLLLLHGGLGHTEMFGPLLAPLARSRKVIGVGLHGHGRTALGEREIDLVDIGNDMAEVLRRPGHDQVDVLGYSMGAGTTSSCRRRWSAACCRSSLVIRRPGIGRSRSAPSASGPTVLRRHARLDGGLVFGGRRHHHP